MGGVVFSPCNLAWGWTMVMVMTTSSKRIYTSQICLPGLLLSVSLTLQQGLCWPSPLLETPKHSKAELARFLVMATFPFPGLWCTQGSVCALQASLAGMRLNFKPNCDPHASFSVSSSLLLHVGYLFLVGSNILLSIAVQQPVVMLVLLQKMSIHPSTLPSLSQLFVT